MIALIGYGNGLLGVNGGLTVDPNCCCDIPPPPPCPPCCVRIDWGSFDSDGNLVKTIQVGELEETTIKIILPRPNDRIICDEDEITIQFSGYAGRVRYGRAWEDIGHSPAIDPNEFGRKYPYGLTDWGSGSIDQDYEITLKFVACFLDADGPFLGYIWVEFSGIREEIEISRCPSQDYCCLVDIPCQDCCAVIINAAAVIGLDTWIVVDEVDPIIGHFTTIIKVSPVGNEPICTQAIELEIFFVPPFHSPGMTHKVTVDHDRTWVRGGFEPNPIAGDGLLTDIKTDWGTIEETELKIGFHNECWVVPGSPTCELLLLYPDLLVNSTEFPDSAVRFEECNVDPEICCPVVACEECVPDWQATMYVHVSGIANGTCANCNDWLEDGQFQAVSDVDCLWSNGDNWPCLGGLWSFAIEVLIVECNKCIVKGTLSITGMTEEPPETHVWYSDEFDKGTSPNPLPMAYNTAESSVTSICDFTESSLSVENIIVP